MTRVAVAAEGLAVDWIGPEAPVEQRCFRAGPVATTLKLTVRPTKVFVLEGCWLIVGHGMPAETRKLSMEKEPSPPPAPLSSTQITYNRLFAAHVPKLRVVLTGPAAGV